MCTATQRQRSKKRLGRALESSPLHKADFRDIFFKRFRESNVRTSVNKDSYIVNKKTQRFSFEKARKSDFEREDKIAIPADHEQPHYSEMLLDDPDALKTWLTDYLQPMWVCELQGSQQCSVLYKGSLIKGPYDTLSIGL